MAIQGALTNVAVWAHKYDITGDTNALDFGIAAKDLDSTTFGSGGWETATTGLKSFTADFEGLGQIGSGSVEENLSLAGTTFATSDRAVTIAPTGGADTEPAYFFSGLQTTFAQPIQIGDLYQFKAHFENDNSIGGLARGTVMIPKAVYSSTGTGTVQTLGAVTAGQKIYVAQHVFASTGSGTLTTTVKSAVTSFATITTRVSPAVVTAPGGTSQFVTPVAGPVTDTFWRVDYAITSGTFTFAVVVGIL